MFKISSLFLFCFLLVILSIDGNSQNNILVGTWKGKLIDSIGEFDYQLNLSDEKDGKYIGTSVSNSAGFYCETNIVGIRSGNKYVFIETGIKTTNYEKKDLICLLKFELTVINNRLIGSYTPINNKSNCLSGKVSLVKEQTKLNQSKKQIKTVEQLKDARTISIQNLPKQEELKTNKEEIIEPKQLDLPVSKKAENKEDAFEKRESKLIKTIELEDDEAELFIYDNGIIDGDIITLIDNEKILLKKVLLSQKPIRFKINNLESKIHKIQFFAENLGEIAPNTGLLVIKTKSSKIELFFSSDFVQSSLIKIILK